MASMSRPRAATSVATSVSAWPRAKRSSERVALRLRHVAVQRRDADAAVLEARGQAARAALGAHEHERELALVAEHVDEAVELLLVPRRQEAVLDGADLGLGRVVLDAHGVARVLRREAVDLAVERGREEQRLALLA